MNYYPRKRNMEYIDSIVKECGFIDAEKGWQIKLGAETRLHIVPTMDLNGLYINIHHDTHEHKVRHRSKRVPLVVQRLKEIEKYRSNFIYRLFNEKPKPLKSNEPIGKVIRKKHRTKCLDCGKTISKKTSVYRPKKGFVCISC